MSNLINKVQIRYIKLGIGGCWEDECIEKGTIKFGYEGLHEECLDSQWDKIWEHWFKHRKDKGAATRDTNQIRDYYELTENDYFITFYAGRLWWCQPKGKPFIADDDLNSGYRTRNTLDGWHSSPKGVIGNDDPKFLIENLDGRISKVQSYQGTVCGVHCQDKLLHRILGTTVPQIERAEEALQSFKDALFPLVESLNPKDFELLTELIFSNLGWKRTSPIGKVQKDIDIAFSNPISGKNSYVQVKCKANVSDLKRFIENVKGKYNSVDTLYFVYHSGNDEQFRREIESYDNIFLWNKEKVVELVLNTGLIQWVMDRAS
ncbi:restriction endonuclease [Mannheimia sp. AT1]|uniref:Restriction endonuclease n=1 Tax=Mannheimia cairinae TaxID=3025936 RepID=A0ABT5MQH5_9PAST|nr:restriction endonuclease [Mannheimia cairinae]MDD0824425.1 restriction endonuclease [Mannheimia cairinae]MDD0825526.1 restriction endonuclease [Mannheimia cairinae]